MNDRCVVTGNKWIYFEEIDNYPSRKTEIWDVVNVQSQESIGRIKWYTSWRQYAFFPEPLTVFNDSCLEVIMKFITRLNEAHKAIVKRKLETTATK